MKNYDEVSVVRRLLKKRSVSIDTHNKLIYIDKTADEVGKNSWGKIDYLCHYCGYRYTFATKGVSFSAPTMRVEEDKPRLNKSEKRANKLNMAAMVKATIKHKKK